MGLLLINYQVDRFTVSKIKVVSHSLLVSVSGTISSPQSLCVLSQECHNTLSVPRPSPMLKCLFCIFNQPQNCPRSPPVSIGVLFLGSQFCEDDAMAR